MGKIQAQADGAAEAIFMSKKEAIDAAITFGSYGKAAGLAGDDLAGFSTKMVQLAGDLGFVPGHVDRAGHRGHRCGPAGRD